MAQWASPSSPRSQRPPLTLDARKRRKPVIGKPQAQPLQLEIEFAKVVDELFERVAAKAQRLVLARVNQLTQDAPSKSAPPTLKRELEKAVDFTTEDAAALVGKVANQNAQQMRRALRAARPSDDSKSVAIQIPELSSENVSRLAKQSVRQLKRIPENLAARVESLVTAAVSKGQRGEELAVELERVLGIEKAAAKRIAIGEVVRINSAISEERHQKLGATEYDWHIVTDGHARAWHAKLHKTRQRYDRPPMGGGAGPKDVGNPGSATGRACRCQALPVFVTPPKAVPDAPAKSSATDIKSEIVAIRDSLPKAVRTAAPEPRAARAVFKRADAVARTLSEEQQDALLDYAGAQFRFMRAAQAGQTYEQALGGPHPKDSKTARHFWARAKEALPHLEAAQAALRIPDPTSVGPLYRGISVDPKTLRQFLTSNELTHGDFKTTSTTYSRSVAEGFSKFEKKPGDQPVLFKYTRAKRGTPLTSSGDDEVLLGQGRFRVTGRRWDPEAQRYEIDLEQVD